MNDPKLKQQIADKIQDSSNILVTVSNDPSVDELSAALGLTLLLNKMDKHATAVFSGKTPPAITFLDPEKTFEDTTDSLRDFIIALDKEKADHLRYKLEGDLVKIYITPYRTTITDRDLEFSQGDYNVELVIALGVENKDHLDAALDGHGKILHDATVVTLTAGEQVSNLGSIDWHDSNASSLSEMLASLHEAMKLDKKLFNKSIATAWLTGIVAATERFSNPRTSSRVMTIAANLMAAGADQQLIASRLEEAQEEEREEPTKNPNSQSDKTELTEGKQTKLDKTEKKTPQKKPRPKGELVISHEKQGTVDEVAEETSAERLAASARAAERALEQHAETAEGSAVESPSGSSDSGLDSTPSQPEIAAPELKGAVDYTPPQPSIAPLSPAESEQDVTEPSLGGTLNATSEQAAEDKRRELLRDKNKVILSHNNYLGGQQATFDAPINGAGQDDEPEVKPFGSEALSPSAGSSLEPASAPTAAAPVVAPVRESPSEQVSPAPQPASAPEPSPVPSAPTLADIDAENRAPHDEARAAVEAALAASPEPEPVPSPSQDVPPAMSTPLAPTVQPVSSAPTAEVAGMPLPPPPPLPDFSAGNMPPLPPTPGAPQPEILGDILASDPQQSATSSAPAPQPPQPSDPGQFRIPGQ